MKLGFPHRNLLIAVLAGPPLIGGCGAVEGDTPRFEAMANEIAAIPLSRDGGRGNRVEIVATRSAPTSPRTDGLRPASFSPLKVEVLDPHDLWDARDGFSTRRRDSGPDASVQADGARVIRAVGEQVQIDRPERPAAQAAPDAGLRPAVSSQHRVTVQLGAFSSEAAARAAWSKLHDSGADLDGMTPRFEAVSVNGRDLVRLKSSAPQGAAAGICRSAGVEQAWCIRAS